MIVSAEPTRRALHKRGDIMTKRSHVTIASTATIVAAALAISIPVRAGGNKIAFPENYAKGVLYTTVDRPDNKQYRELFSTPEAIAALKAGQPIPSGTVLTLVQ